MNATKLTTRVMTMALAFAGAACQPRGAAAAADPGDPPERGAGVVRPAEAVPPAPPVPGKPPGAPVQARQSATNARDAATQMRDAAAQQREVMQQQTNALRAATVAAAGGGSGGAGYGGSAGVHQKGFTTILGARVPLNEAPAVLTTAPIEEAVEDQWLEDLKVMDALLRNATGGPESSSSFVLGVKMMNFGRTAPMYVEGAGVVFSYNVGWPLAPSGKPGEPNADRPRERPSAWDQTKRELKGYGPGGRGPLPGEAPPLVFDQEKLDGFVDAILKVLPEATNFRHLKDTEFVFVTVSGPDESGEPVRLTLKVRKSDVDAAARGTIDAAALRQRVARRVG